MPSRRHLLATLAGGAAGLAGCSTEDPPSGTSSDDIPPTESTPPGASDTEASPTDESTPTADSGGPSGPAVEWAADLGSVPVTEVTATADGVYAVGGTNERGTATPTQDFVKPASNRNLVAFTPDGERRWRYEARAGVFQPTPAGDGVYAVVGWDAGTHGRDQRILRIEAGERRWQTEAIDEYYQLVAATAEAVYAGTADDQRGIQSEEPLFSLGPDGTERWRVTASDPPKGTIHEGTLYVPFADEKVVGFATDDGRRRWEASGSVVNYPLRPASGHIYLDSDERVDEGYPIRAIDTTTATEQWSFVASIEGDTNFVATGAVQQDDTVYVTEYGGTLFALDVDDGTERWRYEAGGDTRDGPLIVEDTVYVAAFDDGVHAVSTDGQRRWHHGLTGPLYPEGADGDGVAVKQLGKEENALLALGPGGDERWRFTTKGRPNPSTAVGTRVYLGTEDGFLVALDD